MTGVSRSRVRCAIYTRKSSEEGLEQSFNSLQAQREACEAYISSQRHEGWQVIPKTYEDGGFSGGNMNRPALKQLLEDIAAKRVDTVVVYKVDRLTRSLTDFARIIEVFDRHGTSFVSVTQQFNTTSSMGRLTLNVLLSFAQFEREVTGERIRDKIAASKKKGMWMGGVAPLGYEVKDRQLVINPLEATMVEAIFAQYLSLGSVAKLKQYLDRKNLQLARETNSKSSSAIHKVLLPLTKRVLEVSRQILYSLTFAQGGGSVRVILFMVAVIVGVGSSLAAEPPTPYEVIRFPSGKLTLGGELFKPKGEGPFPAVLYNHGSAEGMLSDAASTSMGPLYAAKGWVYFMPYRRGQGLSAKAGPYIGDQIAAAEKSGGHDAAVKTMIDLLRGDHLSDQLAALAWLKQQKFVQSNRIAVAGQSFGGIETILGAASYSFCAAVDASGGAMSWKEEPVLQEVMKENARSSKSPTLFFQAENDYTLEPSQLLYKEMLASGKTAEIKIYPPYGKTNFDGHSFTWLGSSIWFNDVFGFIQKHCAATASK